ncbi:CysZ protein [Humitalea rosea]|uniref:CysZ protein n=1 Tax=Humitalea rosea TaxID=990373 RepID=A0A2W7IJH1_9PROT|nr:EI24 domain-containing protein [Humitalea rosea]PZW47104.1 CysZ protein [Humitalea rosea]
MLDALSLAFGQIADPAFRRPLLKGAGLAALGALLLLWGCIEGAAWAVAGAPGWIGWIAGTLGGIGGVMLAWWLFLPVAVAISGIFVEEVAHAVEARHYPGLPPARGAPIAAQVLWGLTFGVKMLAVQILLLPLMLVPGIGFVVALVVSALVLGRGFFEGTAQLRMSVAQGRAQARARRWSVWGLGLALALLSLVPVLGLFVPSLGTAAAVHLLRRG